MSGKAESAGGAVMDKTFAEALADVEKIFVQIDGRLIAILQDKPMMKER